MQLPHTDAELQRELDGYLSSDALHTCRALGLAPETVVTTKIERDAKSIYLDRQGASALLHVPEAEAQRVLAYSIAFRWASGIVLVPTLTRLVEFGAFDRCAPGEETALLEFARRHPGNLEPNLGLIWGAFNLLALKGWLRMQGADRDARYSLTAIGAKVVEYVKRNLQTFRRLADALGFLQHCHAICHGQKVDSTGLAEYASLVDLSAEGWQLAEGIGKDAARAREQLVEAMDGLLAGPTWIALDMPLFETVANKTVKRALSVFERVAASDAHAAALGADLEPDFLVAAWRLLGRLGQVERDASGGIRLTAWGEIVRPIAAPYAALPGSYLRTYERLQDLLFGDPDPLGIDRDTHIDRVMNVYGSSGAGSGPASREIADKIISRLFDHDDFARQPAGIADMGCGDGSALLRLASHIIAHTVRGRNLKTHPLLVVGADYNESARARARETLGVLEQIEGVRVRVLHADIGDPQAYDAAMRASGLTVRGPDGVDQAAGLKDFLHTFMFLVHNRRLRVRDETTAETILSSHLARADRNVLADVVARYFPTIETQSDGDRPILSLDAVKSAFRVAYSDAGGLVRGYVAAADLIDFMGRWKPFIEHGFLCVEGHSPCAANLLEPTPEDPRAWMRVDKLPHPFNWGMHFPSRQLMMPYDEFMLALALAGMVPRSDVYGRIYPEGFPGLDLAPDYRFFSIADYVPQATPASKPARKATRVAMDSLIQ